MMIFRSLHAAVLLASAFLFLMPLQAGDPPAEVDANKSYEILHEGFDEPDYAVWGTNAIWWWEGEPITKERITWQMEQMAGKGVGSLTLFQRAPGHCDPAVFTDAWWDLLNHTLREARRLKMRIFLSDHLGYGETGFMEKIITSLPDAGILDLQSPSVLGKPNSEIIMKLPAGKLLGVRAYPMLPGGILDDSLSVDVKEFVKDGELRWKVPGDGNWTVAAVIGNPPDTLDEHHVPFSPEASALYIEGRMEDLARRIPKDMLGKEFAGLFGDEHPPLPLYVWTAPMEKIYRERFGDDIARAVPALFHNLGKDTVRLRAAYLDAAVAATEEAYWKPVFEWCDSHGLEYGHDQAQRRNIYGQTDKYIDYIKVMRWYSSPGQDDPGIRSLGDRNYYGFKLASSIAALYDRKRVWNEAFYHSGLGVSPGDHLEWLTEGTLYGANLYNSHNNFYSLRGATWTHTDGDWFWRQPYWQHYQAFSDYVARLSFLAGRGRLVADVAVHYPGASVMVEPMAEPSKNQGREPGDAFGFMAISEALFFSNIENVIIDDDSLLGSRIDAAQTPDGNAMLRAGHQAFSTLVFGPQTTVRRSVIEQALRFAKDGGTVIFVGRLPTGSTEGGADDPELKKLLGQLLGESTSGSEPVVFSHPGGGTGAFFPMSFEAISDKRLRHNPRFVHYPKLYGSPTGDTPGSHKIREGLAKVTAFVGQEARPTMVRKNSGRILATERQLGDTRYFLVQSLEPDPVDLNAIFPVDGIPELWNPWTGAITRVDAFEPLGSGKGTRVRQRLGDNLGYGIVFRPKETPLAKAGPVTAGPEAAVRTLPDSWTFTIQPTLDNRWGDFRWPPKPEKIGVEESEFQYRIEDGQDGLKLGWQQPGSEGAGWSTVQAGFGPFWELAAPLPAGAKTPDSPALSDLAWQPVVFSKTHGLNRLMSWSGQAGSGTADGLIYPDFIMGLTKGRSALRTSLVSPTDQVLGLQVALRQSATRLWVNGVEQPVEYGIGRVPLNRGRNTVLVEVENASAGSLALVRQPPIAESLETLTSAVEPSLTKASWIRELPEPGWEPAFFRRTFELPQAPTDARIVVTARPDYEVFVNGQLVLENTRFYNKNTGAGRPEFPRSANITPLLKVGRNVIAAKVARDAFQYRGDPRWIPQEKAFVFALSARLPSGEIVELVSDDTWKASASSVDGWQEVAFAEESWSKASVLAPFGKSPADKAVLANVSRSMNSPVYPLGIRLDSPLLQAFNEVPEVAYDVGKGESPAFEWFRFPTPAGLTSLILPTRADLRLWIDGVECPVKDGKTVLPSPAREPGTAVIRAKTKPGEHGGAVFTGPVQMQLADNHPTPLGPWEKLGLRRFSGMGIYRQDITLAADDLKKNTVLDLGAVGTTAEVRVNGKSVGIRISPPFAFVLNEALRPGINTLEVRVANTTAPFFSTTPIATRFETDTRISGLVGPVKLIQSAKER